MRVKQKHMFQPVSSDFGQFFRIVVLEDILHERYKVFCVSIDLCPVFIIEAWLALVFLYVLLARG